MATLQHETSRPLLPEVRSQLRALRAGIRRYVWLEGLAAVAVWLGLWFWLSIGIDWYFEPPRPLRIAVLGLAGLGLAVAIFTYILRRAFVRLSDSSMATLLERRFPAFNDSLLTTVLLADRPPEQTGFNPQMLANTTLRARAQMGGAKVDEVFNSRPLASKFAVAAVLAGLVGVLAWFSPDVLDLWAQRNLLLAEKSWPRKIHLEVVGFHDGVAKVAAGANFDLRVRAYRGDTEIPVLPDKVEIRYHIEGSGAVRDTMKTIGEPASLDSPKDAVLQEYAHQFTGLLSTVHFDVVGGDARLRNYELRVVPNPSMKLSLRCEYPAYMERGFTTFDLGTDAVAVPVGSILTVSGTASKPLETLTIERPATEHRRAEQQVLSGGRLGPDRNTFSYTFDPFPNPPKAKASAAKAAGKNAGQGAAEEKTAAEAPRDYSLRFTLRDEDGIKGRDPISLNLVAVPDDPPEVKVHLVGTREPVITIKGRLPAAGKITDDHGLGRAWWDYAIEKPIAPRPPLAPGQKPDEVAAKPAPPRTGIVPFGQLQKHPSEYDVKDAETFIEAPDLKLSEGQRLTLTMRAADLCNLGAGPNVGSGETWQLDVVSEDQLLTRLEARELLLRQRFEAIVQEMRETRDLLLKMGFDPPGMVKPAKPHAKEAGAEPGEVAAAPQNLSAADLTSRRLERTLQALQNCHKNTLETAEVAAGVDEIRLQLTNNRVDSEERKTRLDANVSRPLHGIVEEMFPVFEKRLEALQPLVGDLALGPIRRDDARKQADAILARMQEVLSHMAALEDFNVVAIQKLRSIIAGEKQVKILTKKKDEANLGN